MPVGTDTCFEVMPILQSDAELNPMAAVADPAPAQRQPAPAQRRLPSFVNLQALLRRLSRICRSRMGSTVRVPRFSCTSWSRRFLFYPASCPAVPSTSSIRGASWTVGENRKDHAADARTGQILLPGSRVHAINKPTIVQCASCSWEGVLLTLRRPLPGHSARAASGHAAAPPSSVINVRLVVTRSRRPRGQAAWKEFRGPRARAVLRLITSSNLVDRCIGRSPGFSPLRMRAA
jgi:hypothetical protein